MMLPYAFQKNIFLRLSFSKEIVWVLGPEIFCGQDLPGPFEPLMVTHCPPAQAQSPL